jgi:predicted nucleic acid-binding protein
MILVDTNVVSEAMRVRPHQQATTWLNSQPWDSLYLCTPVLAELRYGIERLPNGRQKEVLMDAVGRVENELYRDRILSFDQPAAAHYAKVTAMRERQGRRMGQMDAIIAAIALTHGATIATRDVDDFAGIDLDVVNPFDAR